MMKINKNFINIVGIVLVVLLAYIVYLFFFAPGKTMVVSVSSDGNYAITTGQKRQAILWNLKNKSYKVLDRKANIYSAYFIKNTNYYMWQHDIDNEVYIKDINGKLIKHFNPGFPTYGEVITSDLQNYFASDEDWSLYNLKNTEKKIISKDEGGFLGEGKLLNLTLSSNSLYLLIAGSCGCNPDYCVAGSVTKVRNNSKWPLSDLVLLNTKTGNPTYRFLGNKVKTYATLSPDGKYVVAGDEGSGAFIWYAKTGKKVFDLYDLSFGKFIKTGPKLEDFKTDKTGLIKRPDDFKSDVKIDSVLALKFIDNQGSYLRFTTYVPYAILFNVNDQKPIKYLPLGRHPMPSIDDYSRNASIDTAPAANILVMGKANSGGILVYKFDPKKQTLTKIWDGG